jgi:hypothetical protein
MELLVACCRGFEKLLEALSCEECARYVCNAARCRSKCGECAECEVQTDKVGLPSDSDSELSVHASGGCGSCDARHS